MRIAYLKDTDTLLVDLKNVPEFPSCRVFCPFVASGSDNIPCPLWCERMISPRYGAGYSDG